MYLLNVSGAPVDCNYCGKRARILFRPDFCNERSRFSRKVPELFRSGRLSENPREETDSESSANPLLRPALKGRLVDSKARMGFPLSRIEIAHLLGGILMVVFVELTLFPLLLSWFLPADIHQPTGQIPPAGTPFLLALTILITSGFFLHEFSHKFVARKFGYNAEFRLVRYSSYLTLFSTILPFRILAPGAVVIFLDEGNEITEEEYGKIALAGPTANTIMGFSLLLIAFLSMNPSVFLVCVLGSTFSIDLAWFNLMPVSILDGAKVRRWSETGWATVFIVGCLLKLASLLVLILM